MFARSLALAIVAISSIGASQDQGRPVGPEYEGVWYVVDTTDNNSGERGVYAFQSYFGKVDYVSLRLRCTAGKPTFYVEWADQTFPDQNVVTIGSSTDADSDPTERQYVFELSKDPVEAGLRASPETSANIIAAIGAAEHVFVTAYPTSGKRTVGFEITGTQQAWARVVRHCPVRKMAKPPK
jgi:hypothetical protein